MSATSSTRSPGCNHPRDHTRPVADNLIHSRHPTSGGTPSRHLGLCLDLPSHPRPLPRLHPGGGEARFPSFETHDTLAGCLVSGYPLLAQVLAFEHSTRHTLVHPSIPIVISSGRQQGGDVTRDVPVPDQTRSLAITESNTSSIRRSVMTVDTHPPRRGPGRPRKSDCADFRLTVRFRYHCDQDLIQALQEAPNKNELIRCALRFWIQQERNEERAEDATMAELTVPKEEEVTK
jgi:hypothetical protein